MDHFSERVEEALRAALTAHAGQTRKGQDTPYISHPVHVALLLARAGADDVTLQAALLHDVVEDCEGWTIARVNTTFGRDVAETVADLTEEPNGTWEVRKEAALAQVAHMGPRSLAVKTADKLHNMRTLLKSLEAAKDPADVWRFFSRGPVPTLTYAARLATTLRTHLAKAGQFEALGAELEATITRLGRFLPGDRLG